MVKKAKLNYKELFNKACSKNKHYEEIKKRPTIIKIRLHAVQRAKQEAESKEA